MKVGALFAGYGGIELALHDVFGDTVEPAWFCEFEKAPSAILAHHWPDVPNYGDITKVDWAGVEPVDIITGGSPCQDLSHAGKRAGMKAGTRSGLWASMCDAIDIIRPRLVVWENVRGALSAEADSAMEQCPRCVGDPRDGGPVLRALGRVLGDLSDLGYDSWWYGLRAADVGAAHGRFRLFVFAVPAGDTRGLGGFQAVERDGRGPQEGDGRGVPDESDRDAVWAGPVRVPGQLTLPPTPAVNDMGAAYTPETWGAWTARMQAAHGNGNGNGHGKSLAIEAQRLLPTPNTLNYKESGLCRDFGGDMTHALICGCQGERSDSTQAHTREELRDLRDAALSEAVREAPRGLRDVHASSLLQPELREHQARGREGHAPLAGAEASQGLLRDMLHNDGPARSPQGSEPREQRPGESGDAVQQLSPEAALARGSRQADGVAQHNRTQQWGEYEAAIRRHELMLGRPAPAPTVAREVDGRHQLSPSFCEWLMALPEGHVTDPAIWEGVKPSTARNDQLKALGNGVCPPQAAAALRAFLNDTSKENAA